MTHPKAEDRVLSALIVDDEFHAREELLFQLANFPEIRVIGQAENGLDAVKLTEEIGPDVIFLDIKMPGLDGFQVVDQLLRLEQTPSVVFVTAHDQFAIRAFEVNALDYLLKPVETSRLAEVINKLRSKHDREKVYREKLAGLLQSHHEAESAAGKPLQRITVKAKDRFLVLPLDQVAFLFLEDTIVFAQADQGKFQTGFRSLDEFMKQSDPELFLRIHRQFVMNIARIREIEPRFAGRYILKVQAGPDIFELPLSRSHARRVKQLLGF
jgi:two-component system LytT family response regulator